MDAVKRKKQSTIDEPFECGDTVLLIECGRTDTRNSKTTYNMAQISKKTQHQSSTIRFVCIHSFFCLFVFFSLSSLVLHATLFCLFGDFLRSPRGTFRGRSKKRERRKIQCILWIGRILRRILTRIPEIVARAGTNLWHPKNRRRRTRKSISKRLAGILIRPEHPAENRRNPKSGRSRRSEGAERVVEGVDGILGLLEGYARHLGEHPQHPHRFGGAGRRRRRRRHLRRRRQQAQTALAVQQNQIKNQVPVTNQKRE